MGQLTLLKNVPESGGGGFEKLWEGTTTRAITSSTDYDFQTPFDGNFLDFDILVISVSNVTTTDVKNYERTIYINLNSATSNGLTVMSAEEYLNKDAVKSFFSIVTLSNLISENKNRWMSGLQSCNTGKNSSMDEFDLSDYISDESIDKLNYVRFSTNSYVGISAGVKVAIYGMGKRK